MLRRAACQGVGRRGCESVGVARGKIRTLLAAGAVLRASSSRLSTEIASVTSLCYHKEEENSNVVVVLIRVRSHGLMISLSELSYTADPQMVSAPAISLIDDCLPGVDCACYAVAMTSTNRMRLTSQRNILRNKVTHCPRAPQARVRHRLTAGQGNFGLRGRWLLRLS